MPRGATGGSGAVGAWRATNARGGALWTRAGLGRWASCWLPRPRPASPRRAPWTGQRHSVRGAPGLGPEPLWPRHGCTNARRPGPLSARRGPCGRGRMCQPVRASWRGSATPCGVQAARPGPVHLVAWSRAQPRRVGTVGCGNAVPRARRAAASVGLLLQPWCRRGGNASRRGRDGRRGGSAWLSNRPWHRWAVGKAAAPAPGASGSMCWLCGAVRSCIMCMCSCTALREGRQHEYLTDVLGPTHLGRRPRLGGTCAWMARDNGKRPHRLTPPTTRGTGVLSPPSARRWRPRVWHTPQYPGGGHPPRRHSSKNKNAGLS